MIYCNLSWRTKKLGYNSASILMFSLFAFCSSAHQLLWQLPIWFLLNSFRYSQNPPLLRSRHILIQVLFSLQLRNMRLLQKEMEIIPANDEFFCAYDGTLEEMKCARWWSMFVLCLWISFRNALSTHHSERSSWQHMNTLMQQSVHRWKINHYMQASPRWDAHIAASGIYILTSSDSDLNW